MVKKVKGKGSNRKGIKMDRIYKVKGKGIHLNEDKKGG